MEMGKKELVLVVAEKEREVYHGLIYALRKKYIVKKWYVAPNPDNPPSIFIRWFLVTKIWKDALKNFKPAKVVICGGSLISLWIIVFLIRLFRLKVEIILFRYDIEHFYLLPSRKGFNEKLRHFISLMLEKFCLLRADKIVHKGLENELEFLHFYGKIKDKPHYLFREFLDKRLIQKSRQNAKLSRKDGQLHLVYIGGLYLNDFPTIESFWTFYPKITCQKIHLHIYSKQPEGIVKKLREMEKRDRYFHYEGFMEHKDLLREISKYDYGIQFFGREDKEPGIVNKVAFSNKLFDYISARLPVIVTSNQVAIADFVEQHNIGFSIQYSKIKDLKTLLAKRRGKDSMVSDAKIAHMFLKRNGFIKFIAEPCE